MGYEEVNRGLFPICQIGRIWAFGPADFDQDGYFALDRLDALEVEQIAGVLDPCLVFWAAMAFCNTFWTVAANHSFYGAGK